MIDHFTPGGISRVSVLVFNDCGLDFPFSLGFSLGEAPVISPFISSIRFAYYQFGNSSGDFKSLVGPSLMYRVFYGFLPTHRCYRVYALSILKKRISAQISIRKLLFEFLHKTSLALGDSYNHRFFIIAPLIRWSGHCGFGIEHRYFLRRIWFFHCLLDQYVMPCSFTARTNCSIESFLSQLCDGV
jgi:hypothetical protein